MDTERIEQALREGPPDEPTYVPGSFRRTSPPGGWFAAASLSVVIALVAGIAIGTALDVLRSGGVGGEPEPRALAAADLQGVWESHPIERQDLEEALLARGFSQEDIDAFLEHDPFEDRVRYALRFVDDRVIVQAAYDDLPFQTLSTGTFTILDDGLRFLEVVDGVQVACQPLAAAEIDGSRLILNVLELPGCDTDERMANTLFFEIAAYSRAED
jgi:hypothetical protein